MTETPFPAPRRGCKLASAPPSAPLRYPRPSGLAVEALVLSETSAQALSGPQGQEAQPELLLSRAVPGAPCQGLTLQELDEINVSSSALGYRHGPCLARVQLSALSSQSSYQLVFPLPVNTVSTERRRSLAAVAPATRPEPVSCCVPRASRAVNHPVRAPQRAWHPPAPPPGLRHPLTALLAFKTLRFPATPLPHIHTAPTATPRPYLPCDNWRTGLYSEVGRAGEAKGQERSPSGAVPSFTMVPSPVSRTRVKRGYRLYRPRCEEVYCPSKYRIPADLSSPPSPDPSLCPCLQLHLLPDPKQARGPDERQILLPAGTRVCVLQSFFSFRSI
ncbi:hypothetical protein COCON_G00040320 [Conger conger]|uniref:Uncharacterized protein n=1 Tax=Conger conger TaxID=82655 RepID=A0A9Q1DTG5_CONCO|nr:hypothetical protein COCON_G00040320 [Conger conger]